MLKSSTTYKYDISNMYPTLKLEKSVQFFYISFFSSNLYFFKKESYWKIRTILLFNFISNNCIVLTKITFWIPHKCILKNCGFYSWLKDFISFVICLNTCFYPQNFLAVLDDCIPVRNQEKRTVLTRSVASLLNL